MIRVSNADSPGFTRFSKNNPNNNFKFIGNPESQAQKVLTVAEVMPNTNTNRREVVSGIRYSFLITEFYFLSDEFSQSLKENNIKEEIILKKINSVVVVRAEYRVCEKKNIQQNEVIESLSEGIQLSKMHHPKYNSNYQEDDCRSYLGSGLLIKHCDEYYVLTARHNVLTTRKSSKDVDINDLEIEGIEITFFYSLRERWFKAVRHKHPNIPPYQRTPHNIDNQRKWSFNSDFAILHIIDKDFAQFVTNPECLEFQYEPPPANGEKVIVYGIPGYLTDSEFCDFYKNKSYIDFRYTFALNELNVSRGKIIDQNNTLCMYDANTAGGMSGGPVFYLKHNKLIPIGLHIGGYYDLDQNYFIPFTMPEFSDSINALVTKNNNLVL